MEWPPSRPIMLAILPSLKASLISERLRRWWSLWWWYGSRFKNRIDGAMMMMMTTPIAMMAAVAAGSWCNWGRKKRRRKKKKKRSGKRKMKRSPHKLGHHIPSALSTNWKVSEYSSTKRLIVSHWSRLYRTASLNWELQSTKQDQNCDVWKIVVP